MKDNTKGHRWFVILIGERGRYGPFEVTRRSFIFLLVCFLILLTAVATGSSWFYSRSFMTDNSELQTDLATARETIDMITQEKDSLFKENEQLKKQLEVARSKIQEQNDVAGAEKKRVTPVVPVKENIEATLSEPFISVEEVQITHNADSKKLKVRFIIRKESDDQEYISGYVFIILNPVPGSQAPPQMYPTGELVGGFPRLYKKGANFSIARFKYVEGVFPSIGDKSEYGSFSVLIYEDGGKLRLKKEVSL